LQPVVDFYRRLRKTLTSGARLDASRVIEEAESLKLHPPDLLIGMMQPMLQEIGGLYAMGVMTVATEHRFSAFVQRVLCLIEARAGLAVLDPGLKPDILLICAPGSYHDLGVRLLELLLREAGVSSEAYFPGLPMHETLALARRLQPRVLGLSVAIPAQAPEVLELANHLRAELPRTRLAFGGFGASGSAELRAFQGATLLEGSPRGVVAGIRAMVELASDPVA
jgi:methanogenic corrinoid protein MtbC1